MDTSRGFLFITYKLYHHLSKLEGEHKSHCLNVFLSVMKYAWKKNGYEARLRHETIHKDTGLCRTTIKSCLSTLNKLNVVKSFRGKSGKTYIVNEVFLKAEKLYEPIKIAVKQPYDSRFTATLEEQYNNIIDEIIGKYKGDKENTINELATLPLPDLIGDTKNVYYCKLAIQRKEELARQKNLVDPTIIARELKKISKETNVRYKEKRDYNIRNNIKPWEK
nr:Putative DNA-binding domain [uncultured Mediterranean phage uvMED]